MVSRDYQQKRNLGDAFNRIFQMISDQDKKIENLQASEGVGMRLDTTNTSNPPTDAQLDAAFGTPAVVGAGFIAILDDNGAHANEYLVWSDGTSWFYATGTKAV